MGRPWPSAAKPASCRFTHCAMPAFGHRGLTGRPRSKAKARRPDRRPDFYGYPWIPCRSEHAPGGVPTMVVNDDAGHQVAPGALGFFASMLAPTGGMRMASNQAGRSAASLLIAIWLLIFLPPREAEWRFCAVGKPAGRRFSRAGPRMAHRGDPRSRTGARVPRASARGRTPGARALGYLGPGGVPFFQVTRCKSETVSGRYRRNGYVHLKEKSRL
ncbi:hypothetical protein SAMN04490206_3261 [Pseudomonas umsongensis]|jgi:hypothetical protein|nr:hypothetical protein SAMN04490206_3261 [Pseudomonas umsongensis]